MGPNASIFHLAFPGWFLMSVWRGMTAPHPIAPPYKYEMGVQMRTHTTPYLQLSSSFGAWELFLGALGNLGV